MYFFMNFPTAAEMIIITIFKDEKIDHVSG